MEGYGSDNVTSIPTQIFSVNNFILKKGQHKGPPFTTYMLSICNVDVPVVFEAPKTSSYIKKKESQGSELGAKTRHRRKHTSKCNLVCKQEVTKSHPPLIEAAETPTVHLKRKKESSSAIDSNPSQPSASAPHKEAQQATGDPKSLWVTNKEGADPQLSSGMSLSNLRKPIFSYSLIIHSKSALGRDASADSTAEADPGISVPNDFIPQ
ncbi:hypothetical protein Tco_0777068 [Tanacetum coccineum]